MVRKLIVRAVSNEHASSCLDGHGLFCRRCDVHHVLEVMPSVLALSMVSPALGKGLRIASGHGRRTMGNLFVLVSGESGTGKSCVLRIMREPLDIIQEDLKTFPEIQALEPFEGKHPTEGDGDFEGSVGLFTQPGWEGGPTPRRRRGSDAEERASRLKRLCDLLRETPDRELTLRDLQNSHGFPHAEVQRLAELAPSQLKLQNRQNPAGGRPSPVLTLTDNPP